jgi:hypothetical protein
MGIGHCRARSTGARVHRSEVLTGDRRNQYAAQRFAATTFGAHAGAQSVSLAERCDRAAPLVAGAEPDVARDLARKWSHGALVLEAVAVLVGALAAGVVAIQARAAGTASDDELLCAPRARAMRRTRLDDARHALVLRRGCDTEALAPTSPGPQPARCGLYPQPPQCCRSPTCLPDAASHPDPPNIPRLELAEFLARPRLPPAPSPRTRPPAATAPLRIVCDDTPARRLQNLAPRESSVTKRSVGSFANRL